MFVRIFRETRNSVRKMDLLFTETLCLIWNLLFSSKRISEAEFLNF